MTLHHPADAIEWRVQARQLLREQIEPEQVVWQARSATEDLFSEATPETRIPHASAMPSVHVPREFLSLTEYVACHTASDRFALLYRVLWRIAHGQRRLLDQSTDRDVNRLLGLRRNVSRDRHKMTAFVRFRKTANNHYIAWFEPEYHIVRLTSEFFKKRFSTLQWSIFTPDESAHWDGQSMSFTDGCTRNALPTGEDMESLWQTYFANVFNPARLRIDAMKSEMPVKYWKNLPEAPLISELIASSCQRTHEMLERKPKMPPRYAAKAEQPAMVSSVNDRGKRQL